MNITFSELCLFCTMLIAFADFILKYFGNRK